MKKSSLFLLILVCIFASCLLVSCSSADKQETKLCTHRYDYWQVQSEPTCEDEGIKIRFCYDCGAPQREPLSAMGHTWAEATCQTLKTCSTCLKVEGELANHVEHKLPAVDPIPCVREGLTEGADCGICGTILVAQKPISFHVPEVIPAKDKTCTTTGLTAGSRCSKCGLILEAQELIEASHNIKVTEAVEPTCTKGGNTLGEVCLDCEFVKTELKVLEALGHNEITVPAVESTCSATGLTEGTVCDRCEETLVAQEPTEKKPHTPVAIETVESTCVVAGHEGGEKCSVCEEVIVEPTELPLADHTLVTIETVESTCTVAGHEGGEKCSVCEAVITEPTELPLADHDYQVIGAGSAPTCTLPGVSDTLKCAVCNDFITGKPLDPIPHTAETVEAVDATCSSFGYTAGEKCSVCGTVISGCEQIAKSGHNYQDGVCTVCEAKKGSAISSEDWDRIMSNNTYTAVAESANGTLTYYSKDGVIKAVGKLSGVDAEVYYFTKDDGTIYAVSSDGNGGYIGMSSQFNPTTLNGAIHTAMNIPYSILDGVVVTGIKYEDLAFNEEDGTYSVTFLYASAFVNENVTLTYKFVDGNLDCISAYHETNFFTEYFTITSLDSEEIVIPEYTDIADIMGN